MRGKMRFDQLPCGKALNAGRNGDPIRVQMREFVTSNDGFELVEVLESFADEILTKAFPTQSPCHVDSMLAVIQPNGDTDVLLNEPLRIATRLSRSIRAGDPVRKSDIVDVENVSLSLTVPNNCGVLFVFSIGWRKGLYYDFLPLSKVAPEPRQYDLSMALAQAYCHVLFLERFRVEQAIWDSMIDAKWFPFAWMSSDTINELIGHIRNSWDLDDLVDRIDAELRDRVADMLETWQRHTAFAPHIEVLRSAVDAFLANDNVSCITTLAIRIEGILRTHHQLLGKQLNVKSKELVTSAVELKRDRTVSLLMPRMFEKYLKQVLYADFDPANPACDLSRHSIAHGVAPQTEFTKKHAIILMSIVHQLYYCMLR